MTRYARPLVLLHWTLALLILIALAAGSLILEPTPNSDPAKLFSLGSHMSIGGVILLLMLARVVVRLRSGAPPSDNRLAGAAHLAMYVVIFAMLSSGIAMSVYFGLPGIVFGGTGPLPDRFDSIGARAVHGIGASLLMALIALHIAAAVWHAAVKKDGITARMSLRR